MVAAFGSARSTLQERGQLIRELSHPSAKVHAASGGESVRIESMPRISALEINGVRRTLNVDVDRTLLSVLRDELDLTGTKYGCGEGQCAACTVLVDGQPVKSCLTKVGTVSGKQIVTIEGLAREGRLHPVQEAFLEADALECGWCTPGMIMGTVALLARNPNPNEAEIAGGLNGHICRCGTYPRIVRAVRAASKKGGRA
jgi:aerobic-type carbon monoxide dehydrogenase small subunit (CoxS/CutS family)